VITARLCRLLLGGDEKGIAGALVDVGDDACKTRPTGGEAGLLRDHMKRAIRTLVLVSVAVVGFVPFPAAAQEVPNVDLAIVSITANVKHGRVGQHVTLTIVATNNGPDPAPTLDVQAAFQGLQLVDEICDLGTSADTPSCEYRNVQVGQTLTTTVLAEIVSTGDKTASLTACVTSEGSINDPNVGNDCATATLKKVGKR
jgi:hypothetical protein